MPRFVEREMRRCLEASSCNSRSFCRFCGGLRIAETAAHLVDGVLPEVLMRRRGLTLPPGLRFALARDHRLLTAVLRVVLRAVLGIQRDRARSGAGVSGRCGAVGGESRGGFVRASSFGCGHAAPGCRGMGHWLDPPRTLGMLVTTS